MIRRLTIGICIIITAICLILPFTSDTKKQDRRSTTSTVPKKELSRKNRNKPKNGITTTTVRPAKSVNPTAPGPSQTIPPRTVLPPLSLPTLPILAACEPYRAITQATFGSDTNIALGVMGKESGCNPLAVSATNDHGLMQLHDMPIYDPKANIAAGYVKFASSGYDWSPWYAVCTPVTHQPKYAGVVCS